MLGENGQKESSQQVYKNLQILLVELKKIKDLNNLANEYKAISQNLILSLQDYIKDSYEFSNSFNNYLAQTNKTVEETQKAFYSTESAVKSAVQKLKVTDGTVEKKIESIDAVMERLKKQVSNVEVVHDKCLQIELQLKDAIESLFSEFSAEIINRNNQVLEQFKGLISNLTAQMSKVNSSINERLNSTDKLVDGTKEQISQIGKQFHLDNSRVLEEIGELEAAVGLLQEEFQKQIVQFEKGDKLIEDQVRVLQKEVTSRLAHVRNEVVDKSNEVKKRIDYQTGQISREVKGVRGLQIAMLIVLVIEIVLSLIF